MASSLLDVCRFNPTAGSTTDWTYSSAVTGYQSPTAAGAVNAAVYSYRAESNDLSQWEVGFGAYNSGTGVFARTTVLFNSLGTTAKVSFSTVPQVAIVALAEDLLGSLNGLSGRRTLSVVKQIFTSSGTYTPTAGMIFCIAEGVGSGGGGGAAVGVVGSVYEGGGAGSGSYSRLLASAATIGVSQTVTIGAAGNGGAAGSNSGGAGSDVSLGALLVAKGGAGGLFGSNAQVGAGGVGGVAGTGDLTGGGEAGFPGMYANGITMPAIPPGAGGSSIFGGGAPGPGYTSGTVSAGNNATGFGSGGSGAVAPNVAANAAGGNGSKGVIFITEFVLI